MGVFKGKITTEGRECSRCRIFKPWDQFYRDKREVSGHRSICIVCFKVEAKAIQARPTDGRIARKRYKITEEGRECSRCGTYKTWAEYHKDRDGVKGHNSRCKDCENLAQGRKARKPSIINESGRECTRCGTFKLWGEFGSRTKSSTGYRGSCKDCEARSRRKRHPPKPKRLLCKKIGRICTKCKIFKPWNEFRLNKRNPFGHTSKCRTCEALKDRERLYGLKPGEYQRLFDRQGGVCAICGRRETTHLNGRVKPLCVDHDHDTDVVRGLLCGHCNTLLGLAREKPAILEMAIEYLKKHRE